MKLVPERPKFIILWRLTSSLTVVTTLIGRLSRLGNILIGMELCIRLKLLVNVTKIFNNTLMISFVDNESFTGIISPKLQNSKPLIGLQPWIPMKHSNVIDIIYFSQLCKVTNMKKSFDGSTWSESFSLPFLPCISIKKFKSSTVSTIRNKIKILLFSYTLLELSSWMRANKEERTKYRRFLLKNSLGYELELLSLGATVLAIRVYLYYKISL